MSHNLQKRSASNFADPLECERLRTDCSKLSEVRSRLELLELNLDAISDFESISIASCYLVVYLGRGRCGVFVLSPIRARARLYLVWV